MLMCVLLYYGQLMWHTIFLVLISQHAIFWRVSFFLSCLKNFLCNSLILHTFCSQMNEQLPLSFAEEFQKSSEIRVSRNGLPKVLKIARLIQGQWLDCFDSIRVMISKRRKYMLSIQSHVKGTGKNVALKVFNAKFVCVSCSIAQQDMPDFGILANLK